MPDMQPGKFFAMVSPVHKTCNVPSHTSRGVREGSCLHDKRQLYVVGCTNAEEMAKCSQKRPMVTQG